MHQPTLAVQVPDIEPERPSREEREFQYGAEGNGTAQEGNGTAQQAARETIELKNEVWTGGWENPWENQVSTLFVRVRAQFVSAVSQLTIAHASRTSTNKVVTTLPPRHTRIKAQQHRHQREATQVSPSPYSALQVNSQMFDPLCSSLQTHMSLQVTHTHTAPRIRRHASAVGMHHAPDTIHGTS